MKTKLSFLLSIILISSCASSPPASVDDVCKIFKEKRSWYTFSSERAATDKAVTNLSPPLVKIT